MDVRMTLTVTDLGLALESSTIDDAAKAFERQAESPIIRWIQFPAGALFFTMHNPESGFFYIYDRRTGTFYNIDFPDDRYGGYTLNDYEHLVDQHRLKKLAACPWLLTRGQRRQRGRHPITRSRAA
jgi:hypothetical protein